MEIKGLERLVFSEGIEVSGFGRDEKVMEESGS